MARSKKAVEELPEEVELLVPDEPELTPEPAPVKEVKNFLRQEWVEKVPMPYGPSISIPPQNVEQQVLIEEPVYSDDPEPELAADPTKRRLDEIRRQTGSQWSMTVYRLPNYDRDFNASLRAKKVLCGSQPFGVDDYEETIQTLFARQGKCNTFLVLVRKDNRVYCTLPVVQVEPVDEPETGTAPVPAHNAMIPAAPALDPLAQMRQTMKFVRELQTDLMPPAPVVPQGEISTEAALLKLISDNPDQVAKVAERFFPSGGNSGGNFWEDLVKQMAPTMLPMLIALAGRILTPQAAPAAAAPPAAGQDTVDALPNEPAIPAPAAPPGSEMYLKAIGQILFGLDNGLDPTYVADGLCLMFDKTPGLESLIMNLLSQPAIEVKGYLAALSPEAAKVCLTAPADEWIAELQSAFGEEEETKVNEELK